jgi:hypothetical protein
MAFFRDVSERFWTYVSPRKTQQRRDKEFRVPAVPVRSVPLKKQAATASRETPTGTRQLSPDSRVTTWSVRTTSPRIGQGMLPPSPPASAKHEKEDFEGDTLLNSPTVQPSTTTKTGSSGEEVDANEDTRAVDDAHLMDNSINIDEERERRERQGQELRAAGWSEDAVFLFQKLGMRGLEPVLSIEWLNDLEALPADLFTATPDRVFLRPVDTSHGSSHRGTYSFRHGTDKD